MNLHGFQLNLRSYKYLVITQSKSNEHGIDVIVDKYQAIFTATTATATQNNDCSFQNEICFVSMPVTAAEWSYQLCCYFFICPCKFIPDPPTLLWNRVELTFENQKCIAKVIHLFVLKYSKTCTSDHSIKISTCS